MCPGLEVCPAARSTATALRPCSVRTCMLLLACYVDVSSPSSPVPIAEKMFRKRILLLVYEVGSSGVIPTATLRKEGGEGGV